MVMAGTGNLKLFNILENRHKQVSKDVTYGNHASCHLAMGLLFLGNGAYTLGTSPQAIAALLCAFYPRFPTSADDTRFHNQAFRHLWVLAVERRCLVTRDVQSREIRPVPVTVTLGDPTSSAGTITYSDVTPCLLPSFEQISSIKFGSPRYWPFQLDVSTNPVHHTVMTTNAEILVKKKAGHHSYTVDPQGRRGLVASSFPKYLFSACDSRNLKSRDVFIKSVSASPQLVAFAEHFCQPKNSDGGSSSGFTSFCTNVLYECLNGDKPDVLRAYLWLYDTTKNLEALDCHSMRNLKIIIALYDKTKILRAGMDTRFFEPCLIQSDYLDIIKTKITDYFKHVEHQQDSRLGWMLNHFASQGESFLGVTKTDFVRLGCYLSFFEWPYSFDDLKSRIAEHSGTDAMELVVHLRPAFKDVPFSTLVDIVKRFLSHR
jgi:anaphase-promoting complex subunit 1